MRLLAGLLLVTASLLAQAQAYRWVDSSGKVHYGDRPPPPNAAVTVQERRLSGMETSKAPSPALRDAMTYFPVTLYVGAECKACQEGREFLSRRSIPFAEKLVSTAEDAEMLKKLLNSNDLGVPVLTVGSRTLRGFLETEWANLLDLAGYPKSP